MYIGLKYNTNNIGDEIQSIASEQFIQKVSKRFDRDCLRHIQVKEKYTLILNGWFANMPEDSLPTPENIDVIITGFHITKKAEKYFRSDVMVSYFKRNEPIGCRDYQTKEMLDKLGIKTYFSGCLTLTFPKRVIAPPVKKVFLVDLPYYLKSALPKEILDISEELTHFINRYKDLKFEIANALLEKYKNEASLVITTRLHCALPCIAFGIPVIYFGNSQDGREKLLEEIGLKIHPKRKEFSPIIEIIFTYLKLYFVYDFLVKWRSKKSLKKIDWNVKPLDITDFKNKLIFDLKKRLDKRNRFKNSINEIA